jgi:glycosyltransferase involved in cell wall biosynthesis
MKIIHVIYSFRAGGAENLIVDLVNYQVLSNKVSLIIINDEFNNNLLKTINHNVDIILIKRQKSSKNPLPLIRLNNEIRKIKPDIVHCHHHKVLPLLFKRSFALLLTVHAVGVSLSYMNKYQKAIAISEAVNQDIRYRSKDKIFPIVIHNGVDANKIYRKNFCKRESQINLIQVSRLVHEEKGQDILIEALYILKEKYAVQNITVTFVGEGTSEAYLHSLTKKFNLENQVVFAGYKDRTWIYTHLCNYDLLVQPSKFEGFGLTIVEAMLANVPVLVSNIDGPFEIIGNGKYGFFFDSQNSSSCAQKIYEFISLDPKHLKHIIEIGYSHAIENYSLDIMNQKYTSLYDTFKR